LATAVYRKALFLPKYKTINTNILKLLIANTFEINSERWELDNTLFLKCALKYSKIDNCVG
jgi:hypothetical protein